MRICTSSAMFVSVITGFGMYRDVVVDLRRSWRVDENVDMDFKV